MPHRPRTTVVIVTWRGARHVSECLDALANQTRPHRTLVVDNASDDGTAGLLAKHPHAPRVLRLHHNTGFAGGLDAALSHVHTPLIAWLNDDAAPRPDWLAWLEDTIRPGVAAVGSCLLALDETVQSCGVRLTTDGYGADTTEPVSGPNAPFGFCGGAALLRTDALMAIGGAPAEFFCYYEDTDTAWRLRLAGWQVVAQPRALVQHRHGASAALGSPWFHRCNERNRLLMLLRCAPGHLAARELVRFAMLTVLLPIRTRAPAAPNFRVRTRLRVLADVAVRLPASLGQRRRIGRFAVRSRTRLWRDWAGR